MLIQSLKELEEDGLIERKAYPVVPPKVEYKLTKAGLRLKPVIDALEVFGAVYEVKNNMKAAKQNQKFPFHFLSAPPTPPPRKRRKVRKIFGFAPATQGSGRGAQISPHSDCFGKNSDFVQETQPKFRIRIFAKI